MTSARRPQTRPRLVSVNVGELRPVSWRGRTIYTGIWKEPVNGRVTVRGTQLEGDRQGDPRVHGGHDKAVYAYAREDYAWWEAQLGRELGSGTLGENLTTTGLSLTEARVGERWAVGTAVLEVSEPRLPCFKLGLRMEDRRFPKRFAAAVRPGAYLRIVREGDLGAGDVVEVLERPSHDVTMELVARAALHDDGLSGRLLAAPALSEKWRAWARERAA